jgi:hypothetical protein
MPLLSFQRGRLRILQRDAAHHREALGMASRGFQPVAIVVIQARRHHHHAVYTGFVHHRQRALDGERLGQLRFDAWIPGVVGAAGLPQMATAHQ